MIKEPFTIIDLVRLANEIRRNRYAMRGIPDRTPILNALASGFDTALTLMESSIGPFQGFSTHVVAQVIDYFKSEAEKYSGQDEEISFWYSSYADAIEKMFLKET